jgi:hypothetical protein
LETHKSTKFHRKLSLLGPNQVLILLAITNHSFILHTSKDKIIRIRLIDRLYRLQLQNSYIKTKIYKFKHQITTMVGSQQPYLPLAERQCYAPRNIYKAHLSQVQNQFSQTKFKIQDYKHHLSNLKLQHL